MHIHLKWRHVLPLVAVLMTAACGAPATQSPAPTAGTTVNITLAGSGGGTTILKSAVQPFQKDQPNVKLEFLQGSSSGAAKKAVAEGVLDVAILMSADLASEQQAGLELLPLAQDPVAFVVHSGLPVDRLSAEQIKAIYLGQITNWQKVGGPDAPIVVLARDEDEGATKILRTVLFGDAPWVASAVVLTKAGDMRGALTKTPNSIGFGSYGDFVINGLGADVLSIDDVNPKNYAGGRYLLPARTLAVAYVSNKSAKVQPLIDYLKSEMARTSLLNGGAVPVR